LFNASECSLSLSKLEGVKQSNTPIERCLDLCLAGNGEMNIPERRLLRHERSGNEQRTDQANHKH
jgi:hypothetical protein